MILNPFVMINTNIRGVFLFPIALQYKLDLGCLPSILCSLPDSDAQKGTRIRQYFVLPGVSGLFWMQSTVWAFLWQSFILVICPGPAWMNSFFLNTLLSKMCMLLIFSVINFRGVAFESFDKPVETQMSNIITISKEHLQI